MNSGRRGDATDSTDTSGPVVVSIGGGKGGVGKTVVTANLAVALSAEGRRVVAVDADLEGANLHTLLGSPPPPYSLADFVAHREDDIGKLMIETPIPGLRLIAGTHSNLGAAQPSQNRRVQLMRSLRELDSDFVLIDLGAGTHASALDYFLVAHVGIVVLAPEPTSVENAYGFLRAAFYRRLRLSMLGHRVRKVVTEAMDQRNQRGIRTPFDLLREVEALDPEDGARFVSTVRDFRPRLIVNGVRSADDVKLGFSVCSVCRKHFGFDPEYLGYVNHDEAVRLSVSARQPVLDFQSGSDASIYLQRIARKLAETHAR
ncbi:MAG: P-loop NTPase [Proteobacteria bacterium]|nr:P-loop NTPase [Pseudomonadota bacterium]